MYRLNFFPVVICLYKGNINIDNNYLEKWVVSEERRTTELACDHKSCGSVEKVWLTYRFRGRDLGLRPHPYCVKCGTIKCLCRERLYRIGFFMNVLAKMREGSRVTQVQIRLISQELEKMGIEDCYGMDRHGQEEMFIKAVRKHASIPEEVVRQCLQG